MPGKKKAESVVVPKKTFQLELFEGDTDHLPGSVKSDIASMEWPMYSLQKNDFVGREIYNKKGESLTIAPGIYGAPLVPDKDLLIFIASVLKRSNVKPEDYERVRTFKINLWNYVRETKQSKGGQASIRFAESLRRLATTSFILRRIDKETGEFVEHKYNLIDEYHIRGKSKTKASRLQKKSAGSNSLVATEVEGVIDVEITVSVEFARQIADNELLTIHPDYFKLSSPLLRRLYDVARKFCGHQAVFMVGLDKLKSTYLGSTSELKEIRRRFKDFVMQQPAGTKPLDDEQLMPEYYLAYDEETDVAVFYTQNQAQLYEYLKQNRKTEWFSKLLTRDSGDKAPKKKRASKK